MSHTAQLPLAEIEGENVRVKTAIYNGQDFVDVDYRHAQKKQKLNDSTPRSTNNMSNPIDLEDGGDDHEASYSVQSQRRASIYQQPDGSRKNRNSISLRQGAVSGGREYNHVESMVNRKQGQRKQLQQVDPLDHKTTSRFFSDNIDDHGSMGSRLRRPSEQKVSVVISPKTTVFDGLDQAESSEDGGQGYRSRRKSVGQRIEMTSKVTRNVDSEIEEIDAPSGGLGSKRRKLANQKTPSSARTTKLVQPQISAMQVPDADSSVDEISVAPATIPSAPRTKRQTTSSGELDTTSDIVRSFSTSGINSRSDIPPSPFVDSQRHTRGAAKGASRPTARASEKSLAYDEAAGTIFGLNSLHTNGRSFEGPYLTLRFSKSIEAFMIIKGSAIQNGAPHICPNELHKGFWCEDDTDCTLIRLEGSRKNGVSTVFDLDFLVRGEAENFLAFLNSMTVGYTTHKRTK